MFANHKILHLIAIFSLLIICLQCKKAIYKSQNVDTKAINIPDTNKDINSNLTIENKTDDKNEINDNVDILMLEIINLEKEIELKQRKIELLEQLRIRYLNQNQTIPVISENLLNSLSSGARRMLPRQDGDSSVVGVDNTQYNQIIGGQKSDFKQISVNSEQALMNKIMKRYSIDLKEKIIEVQYMPFKPIQRSSEDGNINYLICTFSDNNIISLYDLYGAKVLDIQPGHKILKFTTNPWTDESFISTIGTDGTLRTFLIDVERVIPDNKNGTNQMERNPKTSWKYSSKLEFVYDIHGGKYFNLDQLNEDLQVPQQDLKQERMDVTSFISYNSKGVKTFLMGDSAGNVFIFHRNGTFKGTINIDTTKIIALQRYYSNVVFATERIAGFLNPNLIQLAPPQCDSPGDEIVDIVADIYTNAHFYVLTKAGDILVYEIKGATNGCKLITKRSLPTKNLEFGNGKIYSAKGFVFYKEHLEAKSLIAFNVTDPYHKMPDEPEFYNLSLINEGEIINYAIQRNSYQSTLILGYYDNVNATSSISLFELIIPYKPPQDWLANLRFPIIIGAILLALLYQWWNKKKVVAPTKENYYNKGYEKYKLDDYSSKGERIGAKGIYNKDKSDLNKLRNDLNNLAKNTKNLESALDGIGSNIREGKKVNFKLSDDEDDGYEDISTKKNKQKKQYH